MKYFACVLFLVFLSCKNSEMQEADFKVWGNCEMCKETIESSLNTEGVKSADWNTESKQIRVEYDSTKISLDAIQQRIAATGYDNIKYNGSDSAYAALPECCQYTRKPKE